jgi:hypothetical protein
LFYILSLLIIFLFDDIVGSKLRQSAQTSTTGAPPPAKLRQGSAGTAPSVAECTVFFIPGLDVKVSDQLNLLIVVILNVRVSEPLNFFIVLY